MSETRPIGRSLAGQCIARWASIRSSGTRRCAAAPIKPHRTDRASSSTSPIRSRHERTAPVGDRHVQQARPLRSRRRSFPSPCLDPTRTFASIRHSSSSGIAGGVWTDVLAADDGARGRAVRNRRGHPHRAARKTKPSGVAQAVRLVLGLRGHELNVFHPILNLAQTLIDPTDQYLTCATSSRSRVRVCAEGHPPDGGVDATARSLRTAPRNRARRRAACPFGRRPCIPSSKGWSGSARSKSPPTVSTETWRAARNRAPRAVSSAPDSDGHFVLFDIYPRIARLRSSAEPRSRSDRSHPQLCDPR